MSNRARTQFECDGVAFDVGRLNLNDSCKGLEMLMKVAGPALREIVSAENRADQMLGVVSLLGQAGQIPVLLDLFLPVTKYWRDSEGNPSTEGNGMLVDLKPFKDQVFTSRLDLALAYIAECVENEYASFLASALNGTGALAKLAARI